MPTSGIISGLVVLDIDPKNGGDANLEELELRHGPLPDTWKVATGGGGSHFYFAYPTHVAAVKRTPQAAGQVGVEVKSDKGYVVAPPSLHESGALYEWDATQGAPSADLPEWMIAASPSKAKTGLDGGPRVTAADLNALQEQRAAQKGTGIMPQCAWWADGLAKENPMKWYWRSNYSPGTSTTSRQSGRLMTTLSLCSGL